MVRKGVNAYHTMLTLEINAKAAPPSTSRAQRAGGKGQGNRAPECILIVVGSLRLPGPYYLR